MTEVEQTMNTTNCSYEILPGNQTNSESTSEFTSKFTKVKRQRPTNVISVTHEKSVTGHVYATSCWEKYANLTI